MGDPPTVICSLNLALCATPDHHLYPASWDNSANLISLIPPGQAGLAMAGYGTDLADVAAVPLPTVTVTQPAVTVTAAAVTLNKIGQPTNSQFLSSCSAFCHHSYFTMQPRQTLVLASSVWLPLGRPVLVWLGTGQI